MIFRGYINQQERQQADRKLIPLMFEGLLLGGTGLGVLALIFEIAADAFSVAAYQTLLAIHGANGYHDIAILAFIALSVMLFLGIVPAYKAGAYLRPNAGGSGPLVEAIGPPRLRWLSWAGTSLFFLDAVLTIIISSISAADVTMLILPELVQYRILLAEFYAFFIMAVLVAVGPKRAVPLFLVGGGAFTIFTVFALSIVGASASGNPEWAFLTEGIVRRLEEQGVVEHVIRAQQDLSGMEMVVFFQLFFRSMSSAMLGFSGYEVIPASGKHAARPKWKVINTALTLAAAFLIGTGVVQLYAAKQWAIPATEGYSTLLIEYEIVAVQTFGRGVVPGDGAFTSNAADRAAAEERYAQLLLEAEETGTPNQVIDGLSEDEALTALASDIAFTRTINEALENTSGVSILTLAGVLLAFILLLAQGGGYVGGAAVMANASRLGRLPHFLEDDRMGILVIWTIAALFIPIIREVVVVESYYAFGFVSAFVITSTTVFFVRDDALRERGIEPGSGEAKSLKFAGLRGIIASYIMAAVLVTQKTEALGVIIVAAALITAYQVFMARGGLRRLDPARLKVEHKPGTTPFYNNGMQRAFDLARQRGIADGVNYMLKHDEMVKFNVEPYRIRRLVGYLHGISEEYWENHHDSDHGEHFPEPSVALEEAYQQAFDQRHQVKSDIEYYSHYGVFTFIKKYHINWVFGTRAQEDVLKIMLRLLFPLTPLEQMWAEYCAYEWESLPEDIWQFSRKRYQWAKDQWPNLSDRITTIWTLQDFGLLPAQVDREALLLPNISIKQPSELEDEE
ncbi:MAG: hypothetical protein H6672_17425 [Anaerolineaceae bacterium]|nr:hypothetical protein [Anaerolineaceae bacterium]